MNYCGTSGSKAARIVLVGEAPGKQELIAGEPFVGASGKLLWLILSRIGIERSSCYCTNVIKISAPATPLKFLDTKKLEVWRAALRAELQPTAANVYVALGATALWALADEPRISEFRGSFIRDYAGRKLLASLHPASALYDTTNLRLIEHDLQRLATESLSSELTEPKLNFITHPDVATVLEYISLCRAAGKFAFDIETVPPGIITCISLAYRSDEAISIPMHGVAYWNEEYKHIYPALRALLADPTLLKVGQNVSYDIIGLGACGINVVPPYRDIMHMHHCLDPQSPHSLAFQASWFTNHAFWKEWDVNPSAAQVSNLYEYNAKDSAVTLQLEELYSRQLTQRKLTGFYKSHYEDVFPHLLRMHDDGICVDKQLASEMAMEFRASARRLQLAVAYGLQLKEFNVNSPQQLKHVLYDVLGMPKQYKWVKRDGKRQKVITSDDKALLEIFVETQSQFISKLRQAQAYFKLASFLQPASKDAKRKRETWDGRLRCEYRQTTETDRLASHADQATRHGINLQNIPYDCRRVFVPAPGHVFIELDYRQAEARAIAWDSNDTILIELFELARLDPSAFDIHWYNAELIMQRPRNALSALDRNACKHVVFGTWYDMQPKRLQMTILEQSDIASPIYIPLAECEKRQNTFISKVPTMRQRQERIRNELLTTGAQRLPTGKTIFYHDIITDREMQYCTGRRDYSETFRSAYSAGPQHVVAHLTNTALARIDSWLRQAALGRVALQVHDALVLEVRDDYDCVMASYEHAKHEMERSVDFMAAGPMIIPTDAKLGRSWQGDIKDISSAEEMANAYKTLA